MLPSPQTVKALDTPTVHTVTEKRPPVIFLEVLASVFKTFSHQHFWAAAVMLSAGQP